MAKCIIISYNLNWPHITKCVLEVRNKRFTKFYNQCIGVEDKHESFPVLLLIYTYSSNDHYAWLSSVIKLLVNVSSTPFIFILEAQAAN